MPAPKSLTDPTEHQAVEATLAQLRKLPQVVDVTDPYQTGTVSKNRQIAYATVAYPVAVADVTPKAQTALLNSGGPAKAAGITVNFGGQVAQASTKSDTDLIGIVIAFLVLLIGFGSVVAGLLPLLSAVAGVAVTNLALLALTPVITESSTAPILATMIGLAVGIDYSLFVMNRHRQQVIGGMDLHESAGRAIATSGSSVCFAGTTVLIALAALSIVDIPFLTVMGYRPPERSSWPCWRRSRSCRRCSDSPATGSSPRAGHAARSRRQPPRATSRCPGAMPLP